MPIVKLNDKIIEVVDKYNHLGIIVDYQLNYESHAQKVINKVSSKLYQFRKMRYLHNTQATLAVYKSMILPILEYGNFM